jgi:PTS system nitrogen regulatory IIA component
MPGTGFADLLVADGVMIDLAVAGKDALLRALCTAAADALDLPPSLVLERVRTREALGSTGFGSQGTGVGAAIPHARIEGLARCAVLLARLHAPIDYGALDGDPVDVVVLLLSPEDAGADHLKALARISRTLRDADVMARLRAADSVAALHAAIAASVQAAQAA